MQMLFEYSLYLMGRWNKKSRMNGITMSNTQHAHDIVIIPGWEGNWRGKFSPSRQQITRGCQEFYFLTRGENVRENQDIAERTKKLWGLSNTFDCVEKSDDSFLLSHVVTFAFTSQNMCLTSSNSWQRGYFLGYAIGKQISYQRPTYQLINQDTLSKLDRFSLSSRETKSCKTLVRKEN